MLQAHNDAIATMPLQVFVVFIVDLLTWYSLQDSRGVIKT